ncbi:MAG: aminotransferase class V-fold PLP-dependent enzyme [Pseudomonadota bacterium]|nr:aminotransferase class V-fold PLP-dependent enzyme [Pseudomonadota bacterium]
MTSHRDLLQNAATRAARYLDYLDERAVFPGREPIETLQNLMQASLPEGPSAPETVLAQLDEVAGPATVASSGGRYFGFVTGGALPVTVAANWLATAWDQNSFNNVSSPAVALIEETALRWVKQALELPATAEGTLVTGATMANFTCLAAARQRVLADAGWDAEEKGLFGAPAIDVIVGEEGHATIFKVLSLLGIGRNQVIRVPADDQGRMRVDALPPISKPTILCIQVGNVNSGAFDPAAEIIAQAHKAGAWVHVDGAFGLWARASKALAPLAEGLEAANSWATDAHKWLNVPYDCGVAIVREPDDLRSAMSISGAYLLTSGQRDQIDYSPDSSRRARAVDIWAALKSLGRSGLAEMIDRNCRQAVRIANRLRQNNVEILNDVVLNQVVVAFGDADRTNRVIKAVQADGTCWAGATVWKNRDAMRISVSGWATTDADIEKSLDAILKAHREA